MKINPKVLVLLQFRSINLNNLRMQSKRFDGSEIKTFPGEKSFLVIVKLGLQLVNKYT